jgi:hypothetical protein
VTVPEGYGVLEFDLTTVESFGWTRPDDARIDVYVLDDAEFQQYTQESGRFVARWTFLSVASHGANGLQLHANRSAFESDGFKRKYVVFDNTDRDAFGAIPPPGSLVAIRFSVRWRPSADPSLIVDSCVNRLQVHENQFVYHKFSGPGTYTVRVAPQRTCLFEDGKSAGCQYQSVMLDAANFANYVASKMFYTLDPSWDIGMSDGLPALVSGIRLASLNDTVFFVIRHFESNQGMRFEDNALVVSWAVDRDGVAPCNTTTTFAPAPPAPPPAVEAPPLPTGCGALLIVANAFCNASACSAFCDRSLCDINNDSACTLSSTRANAYAVACSRPLSCLAPPTSTAPTTPSGPTTPAPFTSDARYACVQADLDRCATFRLRCFQIVLKEQPNNATASCECQGAYASCVPDKSHPPCDSIKEDAYALCTSDPTCSVAACNAPAPFVVGGVDPLSPTSTARSGAPTTANTATNTLATGTFSTPPTSANGGESGTLPPGTSANGATSDGAPTTGGGDTGPTVCNVPRMCIEKCGAANIFECSCEVQQCRNETTAVPMVSVANRAAWWSALTLVTLFAL